MVRMMNSHSLMELAGLLLAIARSRPAAMTSKYLCRAVDLKFVENGFSFGILLLFS